MPASKTAAKPKTRFSSSTAPYSEDMKHQRITVTIQFPSKTSNGRFSNDLDPFSSIEGWVEDLGYDYKIEYGIKGEDISEDEFKASLENK